MPTQAERRSATRSAIVRAARSLFGRHGFQATSIDEVAARAGVSKGAVYHHVESKKALFGLVLESVLGDLADRVLQASLQVDDPLERIKAGCHQLLRACHQPAIRQVYLVDGPSVLGWKRWRDLDLEHFLRLVRRGLEDAMQQDVVARQPVEPLARMLGAAVTEAALMASHTRAGTELERISAAVDALLDALRTGRRRTRRQADVEAPAKRASHR